MDEYKNISYYRSTFYYTFLEIKIVSQNPKTRVVKWVGWVIVKWVHVKIPNFLARIKVGPVG